MKINELIVEQQLDELNIGKAVGSVARGIGAVGGGVAGAWSQMKKGYKAGRAAVAGDDDDATPTGGSSPAPTSSTTPSSASSAAPSASAPSASTAPTTGAAASPAPAANTEVDKLLKSISGLDQADKAELLNKLKSGGATSPAPAAAPTEPKAAPAPAAARKKGDMITVGQNTLQYTGDPGKEWFIASGPMSQPNPSTDRYNGIQSVGGKRYIGADALKKNYQQTESRKTKLKQKVVV